MTKNGAWPMYETDKFNFAPSLLDGSYCDTIYVYGHVQLTYKGWPLYYCGGEGMVRGNNKGVSVPKPGIWPIVNSSSSIAPQP